MRQLNVGQLSVTLVSRRWLGGATLFVEWRQYEVGNRWRLMLGSYSIFFHVMGPPAYAWRLGLLRASLYPRGYEP